MTDKEFYNEVDPWFPETVDGEYDVEVCVRTPTGEVIPFQCSMTNMKSGYCLSFKERVTFHVGDQLHIKYSDRSGT